MDTACLPVGIPIFASLVLVAGVGATLLALVRRPRGNLLVPAAVAVVGTVLVALVTLAALSPVFGYPNPFCALAPCTNGPITHPYWKGAAPPPGPSVGSGPR